MQPTTPEVQTCAFCGRSVRDWLDLQRFHTHACSSCATRLGRLLVDAPDSLLGVWPSLLDEDDDEEPEPKVRLPDGSSVELRERTAELKKELTIDKRVKLALTYGDLRMHREQVLECGYVLSTEPPREYAQVVLTLLFEHRFLARDAVAKLRVALFPG